MKRRDFINLSGKTVVLSGLLQGLNLKAFAGDPWEDAALKSVNNDHVLVLVQLSGGNDGLNTVIPLDQYANLYNLRSNIIVSASSVLPLNGITGVGLHPAMTGFQRLFNEGKLSILRDVGYPSQNYSHFRSTDIWMSASNANVNVASGWIGRYLNTEYTNYPVGYPNTTMPDPLALYVGGSNSLTLQGPTINMGYSITDPNNFYNLLSGSTGTVPNTPAGKELDFLRQMKQQYSAYSGVIKAAADNVTQQFSGYPAAGANSLADQLKIVARLIKGGLKTKVYMVTMGGFDNHDTQVVATDHSTGTHATLLARLSEAVTAFMDDLYFLNIQDRVIGMTFSEFGRRIAANGSNGTDHGAASPLFMFGKNIQPGILGNNPTITTQMDGTSNVPMQYDFRAVYASVLKDWFCVDQATQDTVMLQNFQTLNVIKPGLCAPTGITEANGKAGDELIKVYPNPCASQTQVEFLSDGNRVLIQLFNTSGQMVNTIADGKFPIGTQSLPIDMSAFQPGVFYVRIEAGSLQQVKPFVKAE